jgi:hypothetical protein
MIGWLTSHWDTIVLIGSVVLNALGGLGVVKPIRKSPPSDDRS